MNSVWGGRMYVQNKNQSQSKNLTTLPKRICNFSLRICEVPKIRGSKKMALTELYEMVP